MIYFSEHNPVSVKFYNTFIRENPLWKIPGRLRINRNYRYLYTPLRRFYKQQFPWSFIKEGQTVIQVSSAKSLIYSGISQALIMSTLVGPRGKVVVIEPDPDNVTVLKAYLITQGIKNITVIEKGVWNERKKAQFTVKESGSSWNRITETVDDMKRATLANERERERAETLRQIEIEADTIDNIIRENNLEKVSFINITINGSEYEAIQGMAEALKKQIIVSFVIQNVRTARSPVLQKLQQEGFDILVKHAPVTTHQKQFLVACALKNPAKDVLDHKGFRAVSMELTTKNNPDDFFLIKSLDGSKTYSDWVFRSHIRWF